MFTHFKCPHNINMQVDRAMNMNKRWDSVSVSVAVTGNQWLV